MQIRLFREAHQWVCKLLNLTISANQGTHKYAYLLIKYVQEPD